MRRRIVVTVISLALVAATLGVAIWYMNRDPNRGWDTTCKDFVAMSHEERIAVMKTAGVRRGHYEKSARFYARACQHYDSWDMGHPIGDIAP
jgi:hypothetical protein